MQRGKFITLEGIDGAGKSTQLGRVVTGLRARGLEVVVTREPGGTALGEKLRAILLSEPMRPDSEALLMFAARAEHLGKLIRPALDRGAWVVSDRFTDASFAYQCGGRGLNAARLEVLERWVLEGLVPDTTLLFDADVDTAMGRLSANPGRDRFEQEAKAFHERVRDTYLARARAEPRRFRVIDATRPLAEVERAVDTIVGEL
jgi:dTMP kinase